MPAPLGALVKLYYDSDPGVVVEPGDCVVTGRTGRVYLVVSSRRQERGKYRGRYHLGCLVTPAVPEGARTHPLYWYKRERRRPG